MTAYNSNQECEKLIAVARAPQTTQNLVILNVVVLQKTEKNCTKIYNARSQLLFLSFNLLFSDFLVVVVVVV